MDTIKYEGQMLLFLITKSWF